MPIYMDRHDIQEEVTAEDVANLHLEDLKIQSEFGCRALTYWYDDVRRTAFCLVDAPNEQAIKDLHKHAHGQIPHQIIEVNPQIVESFLGRIEDPEKAQNESLNIINDPAFRIIMVIDIKYNFIINDGAQINYSLNQLHEPVLKLLDIYEGRKVKQTEDHFLVSFTSVSNSVHAAKEISALVKKLNKEGGKQKMLVKISLNSGIPVTENKLFFEKTIRLAERMCKVSAGEVIISSDVKELYNSENKNTLNTADGIFCLTTTDERFIEVLMDHIEKKWSDTNLKMDDICKAIGHSKSQLYRKMMLLTGESLNTFIQEYRLSEALALLKKSRNNISEVAFETGFSSPSYFSKCFRKKYDQLPSYYLSTKTV